MMLTTKPVHIVLQQYFFPTFSIRHGVLCYFLRNSPTFFLLKHNCSSTKHLRLRTALRYSTLESNATKQSPLYYIPTVPYQQQPAREPLRKDFEFFAFFLKNMLSTRCKLQKRHHSPGLSIYLLEGGLLFGCNLGHHLFKMSEIPISNREAKSSVFISIASRNQPLLIRVISLNQQRRDHGIKDGLTSLQVFPQNMCITQSCLLLEIVTLWIS